MGVTVALLARRLRGTVEEVRDGGRTLMVLTEDGETMEFALSRATGYFTRDGVQSGARLMFDEPDG
jgi:hypothetical protein